MAGIQGSCVLLVTVLVVLGVLMVEQTSVAASATPNSYWSCMQGCPGYHCPSEFIPGPTCLAYCATACAIPPASADATHYCMVGCTTSSFSALSTNTNSAAEAIKGTINRCSNICNAAAAVPSK